MGPFLKNRMILVAVAIAVAMAVFVLVFMEPTRCELRIEGLSIDQWIEDGFYWPGVHRWSMNGDSAVAKLLFYSGPKALIIMLAVALVAIALLPGKLLSGVRARFPRLPARREAIYLVLCLALIPATCNRLKAVTNIYCPYEDMRYDGKAPYVRLWDEYPEDFKKLQRENPKERGRGFPAGHASGGFALCAFAFTMRRRWIGFAIGAGAGWWMGFYQMMKGAHYLSHTLVSWSLAVLIAFAIALIVRPGLSKKPA